jgi:folate-dependent phosphoribosylglycinamide formyltransferase PurN
MSSARLDANPRVILMYHEGDPIDSEGLASWAASSLDLVGLVCLREPRRRLLRRVRSEIRRVGALRFLDVMAFRMYYRFLLARADSAWMARQVTELRARYPADLSNVPKLVTENPNSSDVEDFLARLRPDVMIARCKFILRPHIFERPTSGTVVLHPGICPEYRNAHGCFWALTNRDLERVGMTLLRIDRGIDTGPVLLHATCKFDETRESHIVIQYRVVLENLDTIAEYLRALCRGEARPIATTGRASAVWGQPWLSAYLRWKRVARRWA